MGTDTDLDFEILDVPALDRDPPTEDDVNRRRIMSALFLLATTGKLLTGCSSPANPNPVQPDKARDALKTTLDAWKNGDPIDSLKSASPPIVAQDMDWMGGAKLMAYEVAGDGDDDAANLRIPVKLTLRSPQGREVKKQVKYLVSTSPSVTVFRDFP